MGKKETARCWNSLGLKSPVISRMARMLCDDKLIFFDLVFSLKSKLPLLYFTLFMKLILNFLINMNTDRNQLNKLYR